MSKILNGFDFWFRFQLVSAMNWTISCVVVGIIGALLNQKVLTTSYLLYLGLIAAGVISLVSGFILRKRISSLWAWALVNIIGIPISLNIAYRIYAVKTSPAGLLIAGLCSGLFVGALHSLALDHQENKTGLLLSSAFSWTLAFYWGSLLFEQGIGSNLTVIENDFFTILLIGWGVAVVFQLLMLLLFLPIPRKNRTFRHVIW